MTFGPVGTSYGVTYLGNGGSVGKNSYDPITGKLYAMPTFTSVFVTNPKQAGGKFAMYQNFTGSPAAQVSRIFAYGVTSPSSYTGYLSVGTATITLAVAVPEIDGALIP